MGAGRCPGRPPSRDSLLSSWIMTRLLAFLGLGIGLTVGCGGDDFSSDGSGGTAGSSGTGNASATGGSGNSSGSSGAGNAGGSRHGLKFPISATVLVEGSADFFLKASDLCTETGPNQRYLLHKPSSGTGLSIILMVQNPVAEIHVNYSPNGTGPYTAKASFNCDPNKWTRITATWSSNAGSADPVVRLYYDGKLQAASGTGPAASVSSTGSPNFYVGANASYSSGALSKIDDIKV